MLVLRSWLGLFVAEGIVEYLLEAGSRDDLSYFFCVVWGHMGFSVFWLSCMFDQYALFLSCISSIFRSLVVIALERCEPNRGDYDVHN